MSCGLWQPGQSFPGQGCGGHRKPLHWLRPGSLRRAARPMRPRLPRQGSLSAALDLRPLLSLYCVLGARLLSPTVTHRGPAPVVSAPRARLLLLLLSCFSCV